MNARLALAAILCFLPTILWMWKMPWEMTPPPAVSWFLGITLIGGLAFLFMAILL